MKQVARPGKYPPILFETIKQEYLTSACNAKSLAFKHSVPIGVIRRWINRDWKYERESMQRRMQIQFEDQEAEWLAVQRNKIRHRHLVVAKHLDKHIMSQLKNKLSSDGQSLLDPCDLHDLSRTAKNSADIASRVVQMDEPQSVNITNSVVQVGRRPIAVSPDPIPPAIDVFSDDDFT